MRIQNSFLTVILFSLLFLSCDKELFTGKREVRGVWMPRFEYANERTRGNPEAAKAIIRETFERARKSKFNMIIFQVRGNGTSFYRSSIEPWAQELTGTLGQDPGWDPLQFAVDEAHRLGLELHAWINVFPIWRGTTPPAESTPRQTYLEHPEWIVCDEDGKRMSLDQPNNGYICLSPGIPAARQYVLNVIQEIVRGYDIDGLHFDYIRYPEGSPTRGFSHDSVSVMRFNSVEANPNKLAWDHWQRQQVNQFVFDAYNSITAAKQWVKVSSAVIGNYMGAGWSGYHIVYQDPRSWVEMGKIDFIVPMVYRERAHPTLPFVRLITQWQDRASYGRPIVTGLSAGLQQKFGWSELSAEIDEVRKRGLPGVVFFSSSGLNLAWDILGQQEFPYWAIPPRMSWKDSIPPSPPLDLNAMHQATGVLLSWKAAAIDEPVSYIIYRSDKPIFSNNDAGNILAVTGRSMTSYVDATAGDGSWYYAISALDRACNESELTRPMAGPGADK